MDKLTFYVSKQIYKQDCDVFNKLSNVIEGHSKEGEKNKRTPEGIIIHHCDFMNFEPFRV